MKKALFVTLAILSVSTIALAQQHPFHAVRLAACKGKSAGDACSFQGPEGKTISATCQQNHHAELVCGAFHHR